MAGPSSSFLGRAKREYDLKRNSISREKKLWDWGMGFEGRVNSNFSNSEFILTEGYLKGRLGPFELQGGRTKETMGLTGDTLLTTGSFAVSGNALGIPKIQLSLPKYYTLPFLSGNVAIKGSFSHGWLGKLPLHSYWDKTVPLVQTVKTYFHQKSLYGRLGKPGSKLNVFGGFSHQVMWGNERDYYGDKYEMSNIQTYSYVVSGKAYGRNIEKSKVGNHLGSIDIGASYKFINHSIIFYRQSFYDVGALYHLANLLDGLHGVVIKNFKPDKSNFYWKSILLELLFTKNQAGEYWSKRTPSGDEDYYNNYIYSDGWSYNRIGLGTPFIASRELVKPGTLAAPNEFFVNNRVIAFHAGIAASIGNWQYKSKASFSRNYGTYGTTIGHSRDQNRWAPTQDYFNPLSQFSGAIEGNRELEKDLKIGYIASFDFGDLFYKGGGLLFKISKGL